jgi:hypothetical protein
MPAQADVRTTTGMAGGSRKTNTLTSRVTMTLTEHLYGTFHLLTYLTFTSLCSRCSHGPHFTEEV